MEDQKYGDESEDEDNVIYNFHEGIVLAIHLSPTMYKKLPALFSTFLLLLKTLIKSMPKTGLGIYFSNCSKENKDDDQIQSSEGIFKLIKLGDINQTTLKVIDRYIKNATRGEPLMGISSREKELWAELLPALEDDAELHFGESLYRILHEAMKDFNKPTPKTDEYTSKKIFFFTDCLKPYNEDNFLKEKIQNKLRELNSNKITVYPFILRPHDDDDNDNGVPIKKEDDTESQVYQDRYVQLKEFRELFDYPAGAEGKKYLPVIDDLTLDALEEKLIKHTTMRNYNFQCPLILRNGFQIPVKGLNLLTTAEWKRVKFYNSNNRLHYAFRKNIFAQDNLIIEDEDIVKACKVGDQFFPYNEETFSECLKFGEKDAPLLRVIGARKFTHVTKSHTINKSVFVIADENTKEESSLERFAALYRSLCEKQMVLLCWGMTRKRSNPRIYYLVPTTIAEEQFFFKKFPQSLAMIEIPFADEIRKAPEYIDQLESLDRVDGSGMLDSLIEDSTVPHFKTFPNPALAWKFKVMEEHILQVELSEKEQTQNIGDRQLEVDDMYQQLLEMKQKIESNPITSAIVQKLVNRYNCISNDNELKRISQESQTNANKKAKIVGSQLTLSDSKVALYYKEYGLTNCTNDMLKKYISSKGGVIKGGRNKGEMISNIVEYLNKYNLL